MLTRMMAPSVEIANPVERLLTLVILFLVTDTIVWADTPVISYVKAVPANVDRVLDVRPAVACNRGSLPAARCLPAEDFLGPHRRLVNISGILWLLGTVGLTGDERVLIVGDQGSDREFMAGLLYLAGQSRISILLAAVTGAAGGSDELRPGILRSHTREKVWQAPLRAGQIVLRQELRTQLAQANAPVLIDGRSEAEYWGQRIRAARGGHLPGAQHLAAAGLSPAAGRSFDTIAFGGKPVAYAHDAYEGLIYLSRLLVSGVDARLYLEGWVGWASDGALPADSLTYPEIAVARVAVTDEHRAEETRWRPMLLLLAVAVLVVVGFQAGRRRWR